MSNKIRFIIAAIVFLLLGSGGGYWLARYSGMGMAPEVRSERKPLFYRNPMNPAVTSPVPAKDDMGMDYVPVYADEAKPERKALFYRNPMNPAITSPVPAKDDMGMDYVPVYADNNSSDSPAGTVSIDPTTVQNIGVRTAKAENRTLFRHIRAVGRVDYDEERLTRLYPKIDGWIEKLYVNKTGDLVKKGANLLEIYSPQLVSSEEEYLLALRNKETLESSNFEDVRRGAVSLAAAARARLELFDVPEHQIRELEESRQIKKTLHITSPFAGIVSHIGVREGQFVTPQTELYRIADLSRVWVYVDVYEDDLAWVRAGDAAEMRLAALPTRVFQGKIATIYPYMEAKTRTAKLRLEFSNTDKSLKPDMYANVMLHASRQVNAVVIPSEAVVRSGARELAFVVQGPGKFTPREIRTGVTSNGATQVVTGLTAGEEVVTSAQFLIDSESKLREAVAKMMQAGGRRPESPAAAPAPDKMDTGAAPTDVTAPMNLQH
jgi:membrane fusion protein, copper/silver efflux system